MSTRVSGPESPIIASRDELVAYLEAGSKPKSEWRIGTEHEKFGFYTADFTPVPYEGDRGIRVLLQSMRDRFGWDEVLEKGNIIALRRKDCPKGGAVSLEPGGQLELSGAPLETVHQTHEELRQHLVEVGEVGRRARHRLSRARLLAEMDLGGDAGHAERALPHHEALYAEARAARPRHDVPHRDGAGEPGFRRAKPTWSRSSASVSRCSRSATALFANSPFTEGRPNGYQSYRAEIWRDTDPDRSGLLPFAFEPGMGFERYVDYALDVPMYFVYRDERYIDVAGASFRDFLDGNLAALPGVKPTLDDWADHLTTLFPDVRLKRFLEMRGADAGSFRRTRRSAGAVDRTTL